MALSYINDDFMVQLHGPHAAKAGAVKQPGAPQHGRMPAEAEGLAGGRLETAARWVHAGAELIICRESQYCPVCLTVAGSSSW